MFPKLFNKKEYFTVYFKKNKVKQNSKVNQNNTMTTTLDFKNKIA